jgi:hypothetical protein
LARAVSLSLPSAVSAAAKFPASFTKTAGARIDAPVFLNLRFLNLMII